jgi:hypothetical protein
MSAHRWLCAVMVGITGASHADFASSPPGNSLPDFVLSSVAFKGKGVTTHTFPITSGAAPVAKLKLGSATPTGMQGETCQYEMTLDAINAGPASYFAQDPDEGVTVGVAMKFPDDSTDSFTGNWYCDGAYTPKQDDPTDMGMGTTPAMEGFFDARYVLGVGVGCAIVEPVVLAVGRTRISWTFDAPKKVKEYSEANNTFTVELDVGRNCEPLMPSVKPQSGAMKIPDGALQTAEPPALSADVVRAASGSSRDSFAKAFRFGGNGRVIKRQVPKANTRGGSP